jgi:hypothetical protein
VRRTGAPPAEHPFWDHPWYSPEQDGGVAWGILSSPSMRDLLGMVLAQRVEEAIGYPRYLLGATAHGSSALRRDPTKPLPLSDVIVLYGDDDIRTWLLANQREAKDPLDMLVLESREEGVERQTPEPGRGRYPFFDRSLWDRQVQERDPGEAMQEEESEFEGEEEEEGPAIPGLEIVSLDDVSFKIYTAYS